MIFIVLGLTLLASPHVSHAYYASTPTSNKFSATVTTSKTSYGAGEPIVISGQVKPYESGRELQIIVRDSVNNIIVLKTAPVNSDGTYSYSISDTSKWKKDTYKVAAQYGYSDVDIATTSFLFDPSVTATPTVVPTPTVTTTKTDVKPDMKSETKKKIESGKDVKKVKKTVKVKDVKKVKKTVKVKKIE